MGESRYEYTLVLEKTEGDHFKNFSGDGRITLKIDLQLIGWNCVDWLHLAWSKDKCCAAVNTVTPDSIKCEKFLD